MALILNGTRNQRNRIFGCTNYSGCTNAPHLDTEKFKEELKGLLNRLEHEDSKKGKQ